MFRELQRNYIQAGYYHNLFLSDSGLVYFCGDNRNSQLSDVKITRPSLKKIDEREGTVPYVVEIPFHSKVKNIYSKHGNSTIVTLQNGDIVLLGPIASKSQDVHSNGYHILKKFKNLKLKSVSANDLIFLIFEDKTYVFGNNHHKGSGAETEYQQPQQQYEGYRIKIPTEVILPTKEKIVQVEAAYSHTLFLTSKNNIHGCGRNSSYQLGKRTQKDQIEKPIKIEMFEKIDVKEIACGDYHSFALTRGGLVYAFGKNDSGQLGLPENVPKSEPVVLKSFRNILIEKVRAGCYHSFYLTRGGRVYASGWNDTGQLGIASNVRDYIFVPTLVNAPCPIVEVRSGWKSALFVSDNGTVFSTGINEQGQLGIGHYNRRNKLTEIQDLKLFSVDISFQKKMMDCESYRDVRIVLSEEENL